MNQNHLDQAERTPQEKPEQHKFQRDFCQTYEEAFRWRFGYYIDLMECLAEHLGREKLVEMIMRAVDERDIGGEPDNPEHTLAEYVESGKRAFHNMMTWEVIEESDTVYEMKVTECLWAKTFQERNAADVGYATICYSDFSDARAYHSKLKLERTKTIMQGDDCCNHRWTWED